MEIFADDANVNDLSNAVRLLRESRTGFLTLFNNSPVCMSLTTTNLGKRVYVKVNRRFLEKFGFDEQEILGRTSVEIGILDPDESLRVGELIKEKGALQNDYVKCLAKSGEVVHTVSSIEKMEMSGGIYLVSFFIDITKIIDQQAIIERHAQQLEAVNRELEAFSYSVSHDLRAPLRAMNGYATMLEEDFSSLLDDDGKKMLGGMRQNAVKMGRLIDDLLEFARLGKKAVQKTEVDMNSLVREALDELKKNLNYTTEIKVDTLHPVWGDSALLRQVIVNLISNGIKYSSKVEKPVVEITSKAENGHIVYSIRDNGAGFDMRYMEKLFGVFQRLHPSKEFEGTGVGLATVKRIVEKHGGTIQAEAEVDKGATFTFALPAGPGIM